MSASFKIKTGVRVPELDGLRGLAISLVLFSHYVFRPTNPESSWLAALIRAISPLSWSGVDLFFVLSGFLIGGILLDQRTTKNYFKTFYIRRVCRIFPFYYLWLALFFILPWIIPLRFHQELKLFSADGIPKWTYLFFLQNFHIAHTRIMGPSWLAPTWSLAVEEQFYLLVPPMIWLAPVRKLPYLLISLILSVPLFRLYLYLYHPTIFAYVLLPCRADSLLMGVLCAYLARNETALNWIKKNQSRFHAALIVLLAGVGYMTVLANARNSSTGTISFEIVFLGYSWLALLYACLLLIVITAKKGLIVSVMRFRPLRFLGIISYSVYLMHMAILSLLFYLFAGETPLLTNFFSVAIMLTAFLTTLLLATLSWHFFEKPIIRWGHSFSYTRKTKPATKAWIAV